uniref:Transposase, Ptta/En/Spm, plant n=2 Tax=Cajanus cajan TaxID=3821 RepID=A0A151RYX2_CAJCA|nr:hypothetical protein KK1_030616 [Cajanus cajan]
MANGWIPNTHPIAAIGHAIKSQFRGPYHCYDVVPEDVQVKWWTEFTARITWAPHHEWEIRKVYAKKVKKRLRDMLTKARCKGVRPHWIGEQAWDDLLKYWDSNKFKEKSTRNKNNRASTRGGALHTTGRKSHLEVALGLERKYGRPLDPDELFVATHTKKTGSWVDDRARDTYEKYHERLRVIQLEGAEGSNSQLPVNGVKKIQCWKEAAGGKSRGRCYGTGDLASNIRQGVSSLTQVSLFVQATSHTHHHSAETEALRQEVQHATERADAATARADAATARADAVNEKYAKLEEQMKLKVIRLGFKEELLNVEN